MSVARLPENEPYRLEALHNLKILDTPTSEACDRITRAAARIFDVPVALISLVDKTRQWFKSAYGVRAAETPRDWAFCAHTILGRQTFVVPNALLDERFAENPLVAGLVKIRFYAGAPLRTNDGFNIGTLCIISDKPRAALTGQERSVLMRLADVAMNEIQSHKESLDRISVAENECEQIMGGMQFMKRNYQLLRDAAKRF